MSGYYVSRQHYYYSGDLAVEIAAGGLDYAGCDMLAGNYGFEGLYHDPREAAKAALNLLDEWKRRDPGADIKLAFGHNLDLIEPYTTHSRRKLTEWAEREYERLPRCDECGGLIEDSPWRVTMWGDDAQYCSERCCDRAIEAYYAEVEVEYE